MAKFRTHDLEIMNPYYEKAPLLSIDNIDAKFEDVTPCNYRYTPEKIKNGKIGSFFNILNP